jgi:hypothetical protein
MNRSVVNLVLGWDSNMACLFIFVKYIICELCLLLQTDIYFTYELLYFNMSDKSFINLDKLIAKKRFSSTNRLFLGLNDAQNCTCIMLQLSCQ